MIHVYDTSEVSLIELLEDHKLLNRMKARHKLTKEDVQLRITRAHTRLKYILTEGSKTVDNAPCNDCGGTQFLRTGTCHVCQTCGASQGCS